MGWGDGGIPGRRRSARRHRSGDRMVDEDRPLALLMRSAQDGDAAAYRRLLHEITPRLRRAIRRRRNFLQPCDIEDLVQEVLLSLHAVRATYDPNRPFLPWLFAIARNRMADDARRHARRAANETAAGDLAATFSVDETNMDDAYGDPEALKRAVDGLPRGQREAIRMLKLGEMSLKEAAAVSGTGVGALKVAVHRGMNALRKTMRAEG